MEEEDRMMQRKAGSDQGSHRRARVGVAGTAFCLAALVCLTWAITGCSVGSWKELREEPDQQQYRLFDMYRIKLKGLGFEYRCHLELRPYFLDAPSDTASLAKLPVFVIDSVCLQGVDTTGRLCERVVGWANMERDSVFLLKHDTRDMTQRFPDLWYTKDKQLVPAGFVAEWTTDQPLQWPKNGVSLEISARLVDRLTGALLDSGRVIVPVKLKNKAQLEMGS